MIARQWRWLLLLVFPLGYLVLQQELGHLAPSILLLTVANTAACALLLARLGAPLRETLWAWMTLIILLNGYFLRMFWFTHKLDSPSYINRQYFEIRWVTGDRIIAGYPWVTLGFVTICVAMTAVLTVTSKGRQNAPVRADVRRGPSSGPIVPLVVGTFLAFLASSLLQLYLGYGVLGLANPVLPYRLGSMLTLFQQNVAPAVLLLAMWMFDERGSKWANICAAMIFACGLIASLASTSRGLVLLLAVPVLFVWMFTGRLTRGRKAAIGLLAVFAFALYPFLSGLRAERLDQSSGGQSLGLSVDEVIQAGITLASRVGDGGVDGVWYVLDEPGRFSASRALAYLKPGALVDHYTVSVVRVRSANDFRPPGFIGALMIMGGGNGIVVYGTVLIVALGLLWRRLSRLRTWPVILALSASTVGVFIGGGAMDFFLFVKLGAQATACEFLYRKFIRRRPLATVGMVSDAHRRTAVSGRSL